MSASPLVSVIVPVHDVEHHVTACLRSLRKQSVADFEVIVVDDGSRDASLARARAAMADDPRFRLISRPHAGLSAARNAGLAAARGTFIGFVDGDDRVTPDFLERMTGALEETGGDWVACGLRYVFPDGTGLTHSAIHGAPDLCAHPPQRRHVFADWSGVVTHFPSVWNKLYRRARLDGIAFDEGTWFEDHAFFLRVAARTDHLIHLAEPLYLQTRGRAGQITGRDDERVFDQFAVLDRAGEIMAAGPHDGASKAMGLLAHRLIAERAGILADKERRSRFAREARAFLERRTLDPGAADPCWREEMAGRPPLSVLVRWDGGDAAPLRGTLEALAGGAVRGHEVLVVRAQDGKRPCPCEPPPGIASVTAEAALRTARGACVLVLEAGARPDPEDLHRQARALLEAGGDLGLIGEEAPARGRFAPLAALARQVPLGHHLFHREMIDAHDLRLAGPDGGALCLAATVLAETVVALPGPAAVVPSAPRPETLAEFWAAHDAALASVPEAARARLPRGWERRLFLRALWRDIQAVERSRAARRFRALAVLAGAARRGYGRWADPPAGVDTDVPPRLADLLDRRAAARALFGRPSASAPVCLPDPIPQARLMPFRLSGTGWLRFRADLRHAAYANISFVASDRVGIPFHLSLRRDSATAVLNDRDAAGLWHEEIAHDAALGPRVVEGLLRLTAIEVRIVLDGAELVTVQGGTRFAGLDGIAFLELQGSITLRDSAPAWSGQGLALDERWLLRAPEGTRSLVAGHDGTRLAAEASDPLPGVFAPLPGGLWADLPQGAPLDLKAEGPGHATLSLTREAMAARLEAALRGRIETDDEIRCLSVLEHLIHGGFAPALSAEAQDRARALAQHFGLLSDLGLATEPPRAAMPGPDPDEREIALARARLARVLRANPDADPLDALRGLALPRTAQKRFLLALSDLFAREAHDGPGFAGFLRMARDAGLLTGPLPPDTWSKAALLPLLVAEGHGDAARDALWSLAPRRAEWLPTAPIAHVARHALLARRIAPADREALIYGFMEFVRHRLSEPWGQAHCRELTRAAVTLLRQRDLMSEHLGSDLDGFCLTAYGLSREFWQAVEEQEGLRPGPRLEEARSAYRALEAAQTGPRAGAAEALRFFRAAGNADAARIARELKVAEPAQNPREKVRAAARPGAADVPEDERALLAAALPDLYPDLPRPAHATLQRDCAHLIEAALAAPHSVAPPALLDRLDLLADARTQFLGFGLGLSLLAGLGETAPMRDALRDWLGKRAAGPGVPGGSALADAPPVRQGMARLHAACPSDFVTLFGASEQPVLPPRCASLPPAHPLYDVLVVVFSCVPYLETRGPALRAGWLRLLAGMGIPHVIVTGGGDGTLSGDVLRLDAPDDYEGLPQKTLAAIRWVREETDFGHMLKIDDDCFLNAPAFFRALNYRRFDYYGRRLSLVPGQMDRRWHQDKSASKGARRGFDKSPEPSAYADGGSGYVLGRRAMEAVLSEAESADGRLLAQVSFMEDKLVGDLLSLRGIEPAEDGYYTAVRRRRHRDAIPVSSWQNGFLASAAMPVQMVHLDRAADQAPALARLATPTLWPKKIWPSFQEARLGSQSNALDLVSSGSSAEAAREAAIAVVAVMRNEMFLAPHFLRHYRSLGVERFLIADNGSDDGTLEYLAEQPDVTLFSVDTDYRHAAYGVAWQQAMLAEFRLGKWSLVADADELLVWQRNQSQSLTALLASPAFDGAEAARLFMIDMYPGGPLERADFASGDPFAEAGFADRVPLLEDSPARGPFSDQPTWTSALRHRLIPGVRAELFVAQKIALLRYHPFMRLSAGLHYVGGVRLARRELILGHFKYNAEFRRKAEVEAARGQHWDNAEEYRKYLALLSEGRSVIFDPGVSLPWQEVPFVAARLD